MLSKVPLAPRLLRGGDNPVWSGDLSLEKLWAALPRLERLKVTSQWIMPGTIVSGALTELILDGEDRLSPPSALAGMKAPRLRTLELHEARETGALCGALAKAPILKQLTRLTIEGDELTKAGGAALLSVAETLKKLEVLRLPAAPAAVRSAIKKKLPKATFARPRDPDRYVHGGE